MIVKTEDKFYFEKKVITEKGIVVVNGKGIAKGSPEALKIVGNNKHFTVKEEPKPKKEEPFEEKVASVKTRTRKPRQSKSTKAKTETKSKKEPEKKEA